MTDGPSTFDYRLLKTSWGIRIKLTAGVRPHAEDGPNAVPVGDGVWLVHGEGSSSLGDPEVRALAKGLGLVAGEVSAASGVGQVDVVLDTISYLETDYQVEGLTAAMAGWAVERFGLSPRRFPVTFDRAASRYVYDWNGQTD
ncbi:MAG: hypothetical protein ABW000_13000 [Actinoplanes sp.]